MRLILKLKHTDGRVRFVPMPTGGDIAAVAGSFLAQGWNLVYIARSDQPQQLRADADWTNLSSTDRASILGRVFGDDDRGGVTDVSGTLGPGGDVVGGTLDPSFREVQLPFGAFLSGLQQRGISGTEGPFAPVVSRQFQPARAAFLGRAALGGPQTEELPGTFRQFVGGTPFGQIGQTALDAFRQMVGGTVAATPEQQALTEQFRDPTSALGPNLALGAAGRAFSPFAAANLLPSAETLGLRGQQQAFEDPSASFLNFLRQSVGLPAGF